MEDFEFFCVLCGQSLCASLDLAGTVGECPTCLSMVPIPRAGSQAGELPLEPVAPCPEILSIEIVYRCEHCHKPLQVDARWQGLTHNCPACAAETRIPRWSDAPPDPAQPGDTPRAHPAHLTPDEVEFLTTLNGMEQRGQGPPMITALE